MKQCICQICTCGRHRCPHNPTTSGKKDGICPLTEYNQVYKPHPITSNPSFKPSQAPMQGGQFDDNTTQRVDYKAFPTQKPTFHQAEQYVPPQGDMEDKTSYMKEYTEKRGTPARPIKAEQQKPNSAPFEAHPTYQDDYKKWDTAGRPQAYGKQQAWNPPQKPFEGRTTFQHDYQKYPNQPRISFRPPNDAKMSDSPFEDKTCHREDYKKHDIPKKFQREAEHYKPSGVPFDGATTNRRDYTGAPGGPMRSFKPDNSALNSETPFDGDTTNKTDYKKWPLERPYQHTQDQYQRPEGYMDMDTTHNRTYRPLPIDRVVAKRPVSTQKNNARFDGTTNYEQDFRRWEADRVRPQKRPDYVPNDAAFDGTPTYRAHYVPHSMAPQRNYRPDNTAMQSDTPFDGRTMYKDDYVPKPIYVCAAAGIDKPQSKFRFASHDSRGHRLYAPVHESITPLKPLSPMNSQQRLAMSVA